MCFFNFFCMLVRAYAVQAASLSCYPGAFLLSNGSCALCQQGTYSMQAGATVCFSCMRGSFADREGMSQCLLSGMGTFVPRAGQNQSMPCHPGSFQYVGGSSACLACAAGYHQGSYGSTTCEECVPGTYQPMQGGAACLSCSPGMYQVLAGMSKCNVCPSGTYQASANGSSCVHCPVGTYLMRVGASSQTECIGCDAGKYSTEAGVSLCSDCPVGTFSSALGWISCSACPSGAFQPLPGQSGCVLCQQGSYSNLTGASSSDTCLPCRSGTYSRSLGVSSALFCMQCPPGFFSSESGARSSDSCQPCPVGTVSARDGTHCSACESGTFCPGASLVPIPCRDERLDCNGTHLMALPGFLPVIVEGNCTGVIPCPAGTICSLKDPVHTGIIPPGADSTSETPYFIVYAPGPERIQLDCPFSTFFYGISRIDPSVSEQPTGAVLFRLEALDCPSGSYLMEDACVPCPAGFFSTSPGQYSRFACAPCPVGTFGVSPGSSSCLACASGSYQPLEGGTVCVECSPGFYQDREGGTECNACAAGTFLSSPGGSACLLCAAGEAQAGMGATACSPCSGTQFSSAGDSACTTCGQTPSLQAACPLSDPPADLGNSFYVSVRGDQAGAPCLGVGLAQFSSSPLAQLQIPVEPLLEQDVRCHHTLHVMGRPELSRSWTTFERLVRKAAILRVLPHDASMNLAACEQEGLNISFVLQDEYGGYDTDLTGAEATLAFIAPEGKDLLYWTACRELPRRVAEGSGILVGTCWVRDFCPSMDVVARITTAWPGGVSVRGEHVLKVERARGCPPSTSWAALVQLEAPGMRFFPDDLLVVSITTVNLPDGLASFSFRIHLGKGIEFVSFQSNVSTTFTLRDEGVLSVEGDSTASSSSCLGQLVFRMAAAVESGVLRALRVDTDAFTVAMRSGSTHALRVWTQGYACRMDGTLLVLVRRRSISSLLARSRVSAVVDWQALQLSSVASSLGIEGVSIWNYGGKIAAEDGIECTAVVRGTLLVRSCDSVEVLTGKSGGTAAVKVQAMGATTFVKIPVFTPWNASVIAIPGADGLSGRFKVLARLRGEHNLDSFKAALDITPYLQGMPARGVVLQAEEWACQEEGAFDVGNPVLFRGVCKALGPPTASITTYLFTGLQDEGVGLIRLAPAYLHPEAPTGIVLRFSMGLIIPYDAEETLENRGRVQVGQQGRLTMNALGMSPGCIRLPGDFRIPVLPASPVSLRVLLAADALVTQHDVWGLLPSSTSLTGAWLHLSDGTVLDVRTDQRLFWESSGDLDMIPGEGVRSRALAGNFSVNFGMRGIPCLSATVAVQVHPYSTKAATLVCTGCPAVLAVRDDPMSRQFPERFPSSVQTGAFVVQYLLVDGSVKEKPCVVMVRGAGIIQEGSLYGIEGGVMEVTTDAAPGMVRIPVIGRWLEGVDLVCNGQSCADPELHLTVPGDGAAQAPFSYSPTLGVALRLSIHGGVSMQSTLLEGMQLEVDGVLSLQSELTLPEAGEHRIALVISEDYGITHSGHTVRVEVLQSLVVSGPSIIFQIHCSRVWEQGVFGVTALLTDGVSAELPPDHVLSSDQRVVHSGPDCGVFWALDEGHGWIQASFGNMSTVYAVEATRTSRYYDRIRVQRLPDVWTARRWDQPLPLLPSLEPEFTVSVPIQEVYRRVLRWSSSVAGVIQFSNDSSSMSLLSDYHGPVQISCVLLACMAVEMQVDQQEFRVNLAPSASGQIDLGEAVGWAIPPVGVGEIMTIPVYMFAETSLRSYSVLVILDNIGLIPLDCSEGELFQSVCSRSDASAVFKAEGNFSLSQRSGRILVTRVRGRVNLDTVSQVRVLVRIATFGDGQLVGSVGYRFSVRVGSDSELTRFTQPYLNLVGPLLHPPPITPVYPNEDEPSRLTACCDAVLAVASAGLSEHFPSSFSLSGITLDPGNVVLDAEDPRIQFVFDLTLLEYEPERGVFSIFPGSIWLTGYTNIDVMYTHPGTLDKLRAGVKVTLAEVDSLRLTPEMLEIRRIHCSPTAFRNASIQAELVLRHDLGAVPLGAENVRDVLVDDSSIVQFLSILPGGYFLVQGLALGVSGVSVRTQNLEGHSRVLVLKESDRFERYDLPDPFTVTSCHGRSVSIPVTGFLPDGTGLTHLYRFFPVVLNVVGPVEPQPGNLSLLVLGNTALDDSTLCHVSMHMPACQGGPEATVHAILRTRLVACLDPYRQVADVEIASTRDGGVVLRVVGTGVLAFYVHFMVDPSVNTDCQMLLAASDCYVGASSGVIMAGLLPSPADQFEIATVKPPSRILWGFVEVFSGIAPVRVPIVAGRLGEMPAEDPVRALMPVLPIVDTGVLSRGAASDASFTLDLMTDRQRLVDPRLYSHQGELSLMFRVTDRFLLPDDSGTRIHVVFPASPLPLLPDALPLPDGGQKVPASHVRDGWYAVQWQGAVPILSLDLEFHVSTSTSRRARVWPLSSVALGQPFHDCPRAATQRASFLSRYRMFLGDRDMEWIAARLVCAVHVPRRRIRFSAIGGRPEGWGELSLALESFIRVQETHETMMSPWFKTLLQTAPIQHPALFIRRRRAKEIPESPIVDEGLLAYINDTQDGPVPCPPGMYFSKNGTYLHLPMHSVAGEDCYGMSCIQGYHLQGENICVPADISMDVVWICVTIIGSFVVFIACVFFCVRMARSSTKDGANTPLAGDGVREMPVVMRRDEEESSQDLFDDVLPEYVWGPHAISDVQLDDYSATILDDPSVYDAKPYGRFRR